MTKEVYSVKDNMRIIYFLHECVEKGYDLDVDDLQHVLVKDFEYVRDQYRSADPLKWVLEWNKMRTLKSSEGMD